MRKTSPRPPDTVVWSAGEKGGAYVALRKSRGYNLIVLNDGKGHYLVVPLSIAAQLASGIDTAIDKLINPKRSAKVTEL